MALVLTLAACANDGVTLRYGGGERAIRIVSLGLAALLASTVAYVWI